MLWEDLNLEPGYYFSGNSKIGVNSVEKRLMSERRLTSP
jgi:hypothetical protein